jgi:hypothetical protein
VVCINFSEVIYQLLGLCEHDDVHFGSVKGGKFDRLSERYLHKEDLLNGVHTFMEFILLSE